MYLPIFIALLLGLINPAHTNTNCNGSGTVYVTATNNDPNDPGYGGPDGEDDGEDGTGGDNGHVLPTRPKPKP